MKKLCTISLLSGLALASLPSGAAHATDLWEGGYVGTSGEGHDTVVYNFLKYFSYNQYYWAADFEYTTSNDSYVDYMDVALFAGHGNQYYIQTGSTGVNLSSAGYSSNSGYGRYLDFIAYESCYVVPSPIERSDWYTPWTGTNDIFDGLHQSIGFRTVSWQSTDQDVTNYWGPRVRDNYAIWQAWFDARNAVGRSDEMASAVMHPNCQNDTYASKCADPSASDTWLQVWYQY